MWACRRIEAPLLAPQFEGAAGRRVGGGLSPRGSGARSGCGAAAPWREFGQPIAPGRCGPGYAARRWRSRVVAVSPATAGDSARLRAPRVRARRCTGAVRRCARFDHRRAWLTCGFSPRISYPQINQPRIGPDAEPLVFRSFVDHVLRQAQSVGTARVSCAVTRSGQGPRNLAAMMTRRNVTARASDASVVVVYPWARSRVAGHSSPAGPCSAYQMVTTLKHVQLERHRPLHGVHQPPNGGPSRTKARHWIGAAELGPQERRAGTRPARAGSAFTSGSRRSRIRITGCSLSPGMTRAETRRHGGAP